MKKLFMKKVVIAIATLMMINTSFAQKDNATDTAYLRIVTGRAAKIVAKMAIADTAIVRDMIAMQYVHLNDIYKRRDAALTADIHSPATAKPSAEAVKRAELATAASLDSLHRLFIGQLSTRLDSAQVAAVKDGMTYDVLHVTYNGYLQMIPSLTETQKKQVWDWLVEAREHAMDAESSEKKHAWFGKYKGRINNYLSKEGYDVKKEGEEWQKRIKAQKQIN